MFECVYCLSSLVLAIVVLDVGHIRARIPIYLEIGNNNLIHFNESQISLDSGTFLSGGLIRITITLNS
jgi:hypothetical protein